MRALSRADFARAQAQLEEALDSYEGDIHLEKRRPPAPDADLSASQQELTALAEVLEREPFTREHAARLRKSFDSDGRS